MAPSVNDFEFSLNLFPARKMKTFGCFVFLRVPKKLHNQISKHMNFCSLMLTSKLDWSWSQSAVIQRLARGVAKWSSEDPITPSPQSLHRPLLPTEVQWFLKITDSFSIYKTLRWPLSPQLAPTPWNKQKGLLLFRKNTEVNFWNKCQKHNSVKPDAA